MFYVIFDVFMNDTVIRIWDIKTKKCFLKVFHGGCKTSTGKVIPLRIVNIENLVTDNIPSD